MSNQSQLGNDEQLFRNMDEQERIYAPEQVPDAQIPAVEADHASPAAGGGARASEGGDTDPDREAVVGAEGRYQAPVVPAQSSYAASANMPVPPTALPDLLTNNTDEGPDRR